MTLPADPTGTLGPLPCMKAPRNRTLGEDAKIVMNTPSINMITRLNMLGDDGPFPMITGNWTKEETVMRQTMTRQNFRH